MKIRLISFAIFFTAYIYAQDTIITNPGDATFTRVTEEELKALGVNPKTFGEAWRDPIGMIWGDILKDKEGQLLRPNLTDWRLRIRSAAGYCKAIGAQLPYTMDFYRLANYMKPSPDEENKYKPQVLPNLLVPAGAPYPPGTVYPRGYQAVPYGFEAPPPSPMEEGDYNIFCGTSGRVRRYDGGSDGCSPQYLFVRCSLIDSKTTKRTKMGSLYLRNSKYRKLGNAWQHVHDQRPLTDHAVWPIWGDTVVGLDYAEAESYCKSIGAELPTRLDFLVFRAHLGAKDMLSAISGSAGYKPDVLPNLYNPENGLGYKFWASGMDPASSYAFAFEGDTGSLIQEYKTFPSELPKKWMAVRCVVRESEI